MSDTDNTSSNWTPPTAAELQAMLPQYEVSALWGRGGMGAVYKGKQKSLHRDVAIKVLPENFAAGGSDSDPHQFVERFKLEARSMANLDHPAILSVYDFGQTENGQLYIVMEFIDGMDIHNYLQHHGGKLPEEHAIAICAHVLDALQYAHDSGVIHRDIKPSNVLINTQGRVKLADFGLAKRIAGDEAEEASAAPMTMEDVAVGTPDFVAPEALEKERPPDGRADLYAVGVMLYQLLTGKLPRGQFELPSDLLPEVDPRFDDVVTRALQANPDSRYGSATEFRGDLDRILSQPIPKAADPTSAEIPLATLAEQAAPTPKPKPKQKPGPAEPEKSKAPLFVSIGLAALLLIGVGVYFLTRPADDDVVGTTGSVVRAEPAPPEPKSTPKENLVASTKTADGQGRPSLPDTTRPAPEPEKPATPPKPPVEPAKPEPDPKPAKPKADPDPEPTAPDPVPSSTPPTEPVPTAPAEPGLEITNAQLASVPGLKKRLDGYLTARRSAVEEMAASYLRGLDTRMNQAADAGNLKLTKAYQGEKKLVEDLQKSLKEKITDSVEAVTQGATLPPLAEDVPDGLVSLRKIWTTERQKIRADLNGKLEQSLKALESELTKARELEQAELILAYREGLSGKPKPAVAAVTLPPKPAVPDPASATNTAMASRKATKDKPFENSLGMRFVPVPITGGPTDGKLILFSIWETRVKDYEEFLRDNRDRLLRPATGGLNDADDLPAAGVGNEDAKAFCAWLTIDDRKAGLLGQSEEYRLPTDHEWSCVVGIGSQEDSEIPPVGKDSKILGQYPWGEDWPPPQGAGNLYGEETERNPYLEKGQIIEGYEDGFDRTAPVGSFAANEFGVFDLGGNVSEWCSDWFDPKKKENLILRGGAWLHWEEVHDWSSNRTTAQLNSGKVSGYGNGFRVVLDSGVPAPPAPKSVAQTPPTPQLDRGALKLASEERPFVNSIGMKFVSVPGTEVLFCIHETRWKDYAEYAKANPDVDERWTNQTHYGVKITERSEDHPVVYVNWEDATDFCEWLSKKEGLTFRLPSDYEWSWAVGIGKQEDADATPKTRLQQASRDFPWGAGWPPPRKAGNYGDESRRAEAPAADYPFIENYNDDFSTTAPVMSFKPNKAGLFDLGGNVWEWCEDWMAVEQIKRVVRGGAWYRGEQALIWSSARFPSNPDLRHEGFGFRIVIDPNAEVPAAPSAAAKPTWSPAVIQAALEKKPGRLYGWGTDTTGRPVNVSAAAKIDDLTSVKFVYSGQGWTALRKNGTVVSDIADDVYWLDRRRASALSSGPQSRPGLVYVIDHESNVKLARLLVNGNEKPQLQIEGERKRELRDVVKIEEDGHNFLALKKDGSVYAWGREYAAPGAKNPPPSAVEDIRDIAKLGGGGPISYALRKDGSVVSWAAGSDQVIPNPVENQDVVQISGGYKSLVALTSKGEVLEWNTDKASLKPIPKGLGRCIEVRARGRPTAARLENGSWVAWGDNTSGVVDKINSLGPVTDIAFRGFGDLNSGFVLWIKADVE